MGIPVHLRRDGDLQRDLAYGNKSSIVKFCAGVVKKAKLNVARGEVIVVRVENAKQIEGLNVTPKIWSREKWFVIHGLVFNGSDGGVRAKSWRSVNADTGWEAILVCDLGRVLNKAFRRLTGLRANFGVGDEILIQ